eukprot:symbB.v1.2.000450.t1/scaffold32.1/size405148/23
MQVNLVRVVPCAVPEVHVNHEDQETSRTDIVQFSTAIYFVEEDEGILTVDIMRLGTMQGSVKVQYYTEDGSARAGKQYKAQRGEVIFQDQEFRKSIEIETIASPYWAPTLEFKIHLAMPENCALGTYLHSCRVKVIDGDTFPSSRYQEQLSRGEEGMNEIRSVGLFWQYWKLCFFQVPGIAWRTLLTIFLDQIRNAYRFFVLILNIYLVDVLFNKKDPQTQEQLIAPNRTDTAMILGAALVVPMIFVHIAGYIKVRLDLTGRLRLFLQCSLFRKYLNYSDESRISVPPYDMQTGITRGALEAATSYSRLLDLIAILAELAVFAYFTILENPSAIYFVLAMPSTMLLYFLLTLCRRDLDEWKEAEISVLRLVSEVCHRYRLIADYFQRPQMNEAFQHSAGDMRRKLVPENVAHLNDDFVPKWLGPIFMGLYIAMDARKVLEDKVTLGTFLATLGLMREISDEFSEAYHIILSMMEEFGSLKELTVFFNKETDLLAWKAVNRQRRENTKRAREEALRERSDDGGGSRYKTDLIPIRMEDMSYMRHGICIFKNVNVEVPQGKLVAVNGPHGSGKATLLRLLGHVVFPQQGSIFIPAHLRVLHVTQEAIILEKSPWRNLTFGFADPSKVDPGRVRKILETMQMKATLRLIEPHLEPMKTSDVDLDTRDDNSWLENLTYTEKVKLHLARALLMNPEVLVLQRPLHHYDANTAKMVLGLLQAHVRDRGLAMPEETREERRPRTCFFTVEEKSQADAADVVWRIENTCVVERFPE